MEFQKGMDLSFIPELEDAGVQVKDFDGTVMDPLDLVQKYGVNSVRLRIWNAPEHVRESGGYCILLIGNCGGRRCGFFLCRHNPDSSSLSFRG